MRILFLSFTCEDIGVAMVTNMISLLQESFPLRRAAGSFEMLKYKYYCLHFSFITLYPSFITFLWQAFCNRWRDHFNCTVLLFRKWIKKSCVLCRNFISIYKINRTSISFCYHILLNWFHKSINTVIYFENHVCHYSQNQQNCENLK